MKLAVHIEDSRCSQVLAKCKHRCIGLDEKGEPKCDCFSGFVLGPDRAACDGNLVIA